MEVVAQTWNPSYMGAKMGRIMIEASLGWGVHETLSQPMDGHAGVHLSFSYGEDIQEDEDLLGCLSFLFTMKIRT
jgi:hypothetical protein